MNFWLACPVPRLGKTKNARLQAHEREARAPLRRLPVAREGPGDAAAAVGGKKKKGRESAKKKSRAELSRTKQDIVSLKLSTDLLFLF